MKGEFDAFVLWTFDKMVWNWIVALSTARDFNGIQRQEMFKITLYVDWIWKNKQTNTGKHHIFD